MGHYGYRCSRPLLIHPIIAILLGALTGVVSIFIKKKLGCPIKLNKKEEKNDFEHELDYFRGAGI